MRRLLIALLGAIAVLGIVAAPAAAQDTDGTVDVEGGADVDAGSTVAPVDVLQVNGLFDASSSPRSAMRSTGPSTTAARRSCCRSILAVPWSATRRWRP